jgi:bifunctional ADP-heptose synthase (sugar kinase/adenylyltransferase)
MEGIRRTVDTRAKILTVEQARSLPLDAPVLVAGYFDLLRAEHARDLAALRSRTGARTLVAAVLPWPDAYMSQRARAEMAAALRMVDYVVALEPDELATLVDALRPCEVVRWEDTDARRNRELIEHVYRRHSS